MSRRLLTAALIVAALLAGRATAKPPDLPLPQNDVLAPETPPIPLEASPYVFPQAAGVAAPLTEATLFFRLRPSVRRTIASCLLFGANPLLALAPTEEYVDFDEDDAPQATKTPGPVAEMKQIIADDSKPSVCPWMRRRQCAPDRNTVLSADLDLSHDVLDNLVMLRQAHELLRDARELGRAGRVCEALDCLELAHSLCPTSWLEDRIQEASAEVFASCYCGEPRDDGADEEQSEPPAGRTIEQKLMRAVSFQFDETPLGRVIDEIRASQGVNIYVDKAALDADEVSLDTPISIKLEEVSLKSALHLILKSVHLNCFVKDGVIRITTERVAPIQKVTFQVENVLVPVAPRQSSESAPLRPCLPPVDPEVPVTLDGLYPETTVRLADGEEQEPPADVLKGIAKPFLVRIHSGLDDEGDVPEVEVGLAKDGGSPMSWLDAVKEFAAVMPPDHGELFLGPDGSVRVFTQVRHGGAVWHMLYSNGALSVWSSPDGGADADPSPAENPPDDASAD